MNLRIAFGLFNGTLWLIAMCVMLTLILHGHLAMCLIWAFAAVVIVSMSVLSDENLKSIED